MKFTSFVALIGSAVAIKTDSLAASNVNVQYQKCKYKNSAGTCILLNENLQPYNCELNLSGEFFRDIIPPFRDMCAW